MLIPTVYLHHYPFFKKTKTLPCKLGNCQFTQLLDPIACPSPMFSSLTLCAYTHLCVVVGRRLELIGLIYPETCGWIIDGKQLEIVQLYYTCFKVLNDPYICGTSAGRSQVSQRRAGKEGCFWFVNFDQALTNEVDPLKAFHCYDYFLFVSIMVAPRCIDQEGDSVV